MATISINKKRRQRRKATAWRLGRTLGVHATTFLRLSPEGIRAYIGNLKWERGRLRAGPRDRNRRGRIRRAIPLLRRLEKLHGGVQ